AGVSPWAAAACAAKSVTPRPTPSPTFARRRRAGAAVVLFTVIVLDGKLATRPVETRYEAAKRAPANAAGHVRRHDIHQTNRTLRHAGGPTGRNNAGWDIGFG
ncbi:TPA: hypothetical protein ACYLK4_006763, partial [Burkholderia cenocepacia]